jgi:hypothetical protein
LTLQARLKALTVAALLPFAAHAAAPPAPVTQTLTCPVGGERFPFTSLSAYATWGQRPDGKPYGSWVFPAPLPECPDNGLVMYRDFSRDERGRLPAILADPGFVALREGQGTWYRAAYLEHALQPRSPVTAWLLLNATWEAQDGSLRKARYQDEFVDAVQVLGGEAAPIEAFALRVRAANALRELGRFEEARAALAALPRDTLASDPAAAQWGAFLDGLARAIARGDRTPEPLDLIPRQVAAAYCLGGVSAPPRGDPECSTPDMTQAMKAVRDARGAHAAH